jgi:hypothetical protein
MSAELYTFQVIAGEHQGNKRKYVKGEIFQSVNELDKLFEGKFQRIPNTPAPIEDSTPIDPVPPALQERRPTVPNGTPKEPLPFSFVESANVSHLFPEASTAGLEVFKDSLGGYAIAETGVQVKQNLAGQILSSKQKVRDFLADFKPVDGKD